MTSCSLFLTTSQIQLNDCLKHEFILWYASKPHPKIISTMVQKKKLVDLVHLNENITESHLKADYLARISSWERWVEHKQSDDVITMNRYVQENAEYYAIDGYLSIFLKKRLEWIFSSVADPEMRLKYLLVLPPFSQKGNIKSLLLHFFQLADHSQQSKIVFNSLNRQEKELRILWDMYKLSRTLETIQTLRKWLAGRNRSSSNISGQQASTSLDNLQKSLMMIFRICIQKNYQTRYLKEFPKDIFLPESILSRRESGSSLVNSKILDSLEYRNYLFFIYYKSRIRGELEGISYEYEINYLDYELIRQEFLIHWISQRLKNNPRKQEVFEQYKFGSKTFTQITANRPEMEISLLKKLPKNVFDDLMAQVNDGLDPDMQAPVDPMSETFGSFASELLKFEKAKVLAKKSVEAIRTFIEKTNKRKKAVIPVKDDPQETLPTVPKKPLKEFRIQIVKMDEISFPFFCENNAHFSRLLKLFKLKLQPDRYTKLKAKIKLFFNQTPENLRITRRSPRHEWAIPLIIHEAENSDLTGQLLIMGAELKAQSPGMGYTNDSEQKYDFHTYFVYGAEKKYADLGIINESRRVKGDRYFIYDVSHPTVISRALKLIDMIIKRGDSLQAQ